MCLSRPLPAPLASVGDAMAEEVDLAELWARAFAAVEGDLRALVQVAREVGLEGDEVDEAADAIRAPVGHTELSRLRGLQFRESCAAALASHLRAAGHSSPLISEWAGEDERRVRPRLA
jgi:hypothetical protein